MKHQTNQKQNNQYLEFQDEASKANLNQHVLNSSQNVKRRNSIELQNSQQIQRQDVSFEVYSNGDLSKPKIVQKQNQEREQEKQRKCRKCVTFVFGFIPIVVMISIFLVFLFDDSIKQRVVDAFQNITELNLKISFYIVIYGMLLIFLSFPYLIFEMCLGFTFSYPIAVFFAVFAKTLGEILCFVVSRYILKSFFIEILRMNEYFTVLERAVKKYPWLISNLLRGSIIIPLFVVNFGSGIINLSLVQYLVPALVWGTLYSMFAVFCGSQLQSLKELLQNSEYPKHPFLFFFELITVIISLILMGAIIWKSRKIYNNIKQEMQDQIKMEKQLAQQKLQTAQKIQA